MRTYFDEYEKIKDKAVVINDYIWKIMDPEDREKTLSEKTVITRGGTGPAYKVFWIKGNVNRLSELECAIIADRGNLCFGYRMEGNKIVVYTD